MMHIKDLAFSLTRDLPIGAFGIPTTGAAPFVVTESVSGDANFAIVELEGRRAFELTEAREYLDDSIITFRRWQLQVDHMSGAQLSSLDPVERAGCAFVAEDSFGIYVVDGTDSGSRAIGLDGRFVDHPDEGVVFPAWRIIVEQAEGTKVLYDRSCELD